MASSTREKILNTAKNLFTERGYNAVSIGDIASEVGISKGNLTYYFKKKEEMVEALLNRNTPYREREIPRTIRELNEDFQHIEAVVNDNAFYFWHHAQMAQVSPHIRLLQEKAFSDNRAFLQRAFESLADENLIELPDEPSSLVNAVLMVEVYWLPFCDLAGTDSVSFQQQIWSIVIPYLTEKGMAEYEDFSERSENDLFRS